MMHLPVGLLQSTPEKNYKRRHQEISFDLILVAVPGTAKFKVHHVVLINRKEDGS